MSSLFAEPRDYLYLCPTDSAATVASFPTQEMRSAVRENGDVTATFAMGINDPAPPILVNGAAITP
jgi:hypothetical protein